MTNLEKLEADIRQKLSHIEYGAMLNNVLEWLHITEKRSIGVFAADYLDPDNIDPIWDLKSVYLKDQSQELIDYLAGLI